MVRAVYNGVVLAETPRTLRVEGSHYFPPESINRYYHVHAGDAIVEGEPEGPQRRLFVRTRWPVPLSSVRAAR